MGFFSKIFARKKNAHDIGIDDNPWAGLSSYEDPEKAVREGRSPKLFCGRDDESHSVSQLIGGNIFVTLYGKSGTGKTSLLNAGVFPRMRQRRYLPVSIRLSMDATDTTFQQCVIRQILQALDLAHGHQRTIDVVPLASNEQQPDYLWSFFARTRFTDEDGRTLFPIIVFDQFEEVLRSRVQESEVLLRQIAYIMDESHALPNRMIDGQTYTYDFNFRFVVSIREDDLYLLEDSIDNNYLSELKRCRYRLRSLSEQGARDAILLPGAGLFKTEDQNEIVDAIIGKSRNEDGSISTNIVSLLCSRIYVDFQKSGADYVTPALVDNFIKGNPFERFYNEATQGFSSREKSFIEDNLVDSTGRRNSIPESDFLLHVKNGVKLLEGKNRILQRISTSSDGKIYRIELIHDSFCDPLAELQKKREQRRRVLIYATAASIVLLCVGISALIFSLRDTVSQREKDLEVKTKELESINDQLTRTYQEVEKEKNAALLAYQERTKAFADLEFANKEILKKKQELDENVGLLTSANWGIKENQARFVAEKANALIDIDSYFARMLSLYVLPENVNNPNIPFVLEAEIALRNSLYKGITQLNGHMMTVNSIEFSQDGKYLISASDDNTIKLWDSATGALLKSINGENGPVDYASLSSDNKKIVSVVRNKLFVWDVSSEELIDTLSVIAKAVIFDENDENIIAVSNTFVDTWDLKERKRISHRELELGPNSILRNNHFLDISFSCDKSEIILRDEYAVNHSCSFDVQSGKRTNSNVSLAYCPNAHISVLNDDDSKLNYIIETETQTRIKELPQGFSTMIFDLSGEKLAAVYKDNSIVLWDTDISNVYLGHANDVNTAVFSPDGKYILSSSSDSTICIRDIRTHEVVKRMRRNGDYSDVAFYYPNGKNIISATRDSKICTWEPKNDGYSVREIQRHQGPVLDVHVSPDDQWLLSTANDSSFTVGDAHHKKGYYRIKLKDNPVSCGAFRPDSKQFAVSVIGWILIFDTESGEMINSFPVHRKTVTGVDVSHVVKSICFSPNGNYIVTSSSDNTAAIWNVSTGELVHSLEGHTKSVECANYSPDGKYIVTASYDGTIKVWMSDSGIEIASIKGHLEGVNYASFSPDGQKIVSASSDKTIRIWDFPPLQQLINETRNHFKNRQLTPEERRKYYLM